MFPRDTCNYSANGYVANSKFIRKCRTSHSQVVKAAYRPNVGIVQFCMSVSLAAWSAFRVFEKRVVIAQHRDPVRVVSFLCKVGHVFGVCCKEKMAWIYTRRVVACMTYLKALWDWSVKIPVYEPMGANVFPINSNVSVFSTYAASPFPTMSLQVSKRWKLNLIHESLYRCFSPTWHKQENRRQAKVLSARSSRDCLTAVKRCFGVNAFIGYNRAS